VSGDQTDDEALETYRKARSRLAAGGFRLRKWMTNSARLLGKINESEVDATSRVENAGDATTYAKSVLGEGDGLSAEKVLGMSWNVKVDTLVVPVDIVGERARALPVSKISILSVLAGMYDPLGIVSPIGVSMKILFQELCVKGVNWDEQLGGEIERRWLEWVSDLEVVKEVSVPRCVCVK
jgi:hypothetical protein